MRFSASRVWWVVLMTFVTHRGGVKKLDDLLSIGGKLGM